MKLNLGSGGNKMEGYVNVDFYESCNPDQLVNLEQFPWPWPDNSVDEIVLSHVLEHLGETRDVFLGIMKEMWRVCKHDAKIFIVVPDYRSDSFWGDPTHVRVVTPQMLMLFDQEENRKTLANGNANTPLGLIHNINFKIATAGVNFQKHYKEQIDSGLVTFKEVLALSRDYNNVVDEVHILLIAKKES